MKPYKTYPSHGGFEIDVNVLTGKSIEYKKAFAFMLIVKHHYTNSMIYDYSAKSLSGKLGISNYITETYTNRMIKLGYCHFDGKNSQHLQFISLNKIMPFRSRGAIIKLSDQSTINTIVEEINILILKNNFSNQDKLIKIKSDLNKSKIKDADINIKSYKKSLKYSYSHPEIKDERLIDFNVIGLRKLAQILGSSLNYAAYFVLRLAAKNIIKIKHIVKKYADFEFNQFSSDELKKSINKKSGYFYSYAGMTFHFLGSRIDFI